MCNFLRNELVGSKVYFEKYELNEHLKPFYDHLMKKDPNPYNPFAFPVQMNFLNQRIRLEREVDKEIITSKNKNSTGENQIEVHVIDRSIFEDNEIFAKNQLDSGMMTQEEYESYLQLYNKTIDEITKPDIVIVLNQEVKTLHERIMKRGREMEKDMSIEYLQNLQNRYDYALLPFLTQRGVKFFRPEADPNSDPLISNKKILEVIVKGLNLPQNI